MGPNLMKTSCFWILTFGLIWSASGPAAAADKVADFVMEIDRLKYEFVDGMHKYHHARRYVVRNDVGVTLTKGRICYVEQKKCLSAVVKYRIDAGKSLTQPRHLVSTKLDEETVTVEYWGKDDTGHEFLAKKTFLLKGDSVTIQ
jgi:hypothetical protein